MNYKPKGFSIAAAAVSLTLILPGVVPVVPPQAVAQTASENTPENANPTGATRAAAESDAVAEAFFADAIEATGVKDAKGTVNGNVAELGTIPETYIQDAVVAGKPLGGVEVYARWTEKEKNGQISSPLYKTVTKDDGTFSIALKPYLDANGKEHTFTADPTAAYKEKIQLWFRAPDDSLELFWSYGYRPVPDGIVVDTTGGADWTGGRVRNARALFKKKDDPSLPNHKPRDQWVVQSAENMNGKNGDVSGRIYWNWVQGVGSLRWRDVNNPDYDRGIPNVEVVASYLSDKAVNAIEKYYNDNKATLFNNHPLRKPGWTYEDAVTLNNWIMGQVKANPDWIAETVMTTTDAKGAYKIRFNGTWGRDDRSAGSVPKDKVGTVASSPNEGSWGDSGTSKDTKHVNWEWMYISTSNMPPVAGVTNPFRNEIWGGADMWSSRALLTRGNDPMGTGNLIAANATQDLTQDYFADLHIGALTPHSIFGVLSYDTRTKFATPGVTVDTGAAGWPSQADQKYRIIWTDPNGNEVKRCEEFADADGRIPSCPLNVPEDLKEVSTYTATLYALPDGKDPLVMGVDSFTAIPARLHTPYGAVGQNYPLQTPGNPANVKDGQVAAFVEVPSTIGKAEVTWTYELDPETPLPQGLSLDEKTGKITGTPTEFGTFPVRVTAVGTIPSASGGTKEVRIGTTDNLTVTKATMLDYTFTEGKKGTKPISIVGLPQNATDKEGKPVTVVATNFTAVGDRPKGFSLAPDGMLTVDETAKAGTYTDVTVQYEVTDEDGVKHTIQDGVKVVVDPNPALVKQDRDTYQPQVGSDTPTVEQGSSVTTAPLTFDDPNTPETESAPSGTRFDAPDATALNSIFPDATPAPDWVTVNPDGSVTANPPKDTKPGVYQVPVRANYPDGSSEIVFVPVEVTKRTPDAEKYGPTYGSTPTSVAQDSRGSVTDPSFDDPNTTDVQERVPAGTTFAPGADAPDWVEVDPQTGMLTLRPNAEVPVGTYEVPVTVTYPDGSTDTITAPVVVTEKVLTQAEANVPAYPQATEVSQRGETTIPVTFDRPRTSEKEEMPQGTTFAKGTGDNVPEWATVDPATGTITAKPGADVPAGDYTVPVVVTYPDGTTETVNVPVHVNQYVTDAEKNQAAYPPEPTVVGKDAPVTIPAPTLVDGSPLPEGSTFGPGDNVPGWVTVDPATGKITVKPGANVPAGDTTIPVVVTYPDGSTQTINATVTVLPAADASQPLYPSSTTTVPAGSEATIAAPSFDDPTTDGIEKAPEGTTFAKGTGDNVPEWATVDPNTGEITVKPGADVPAGEYTVPVDVTYPDGSTDTVNIPVKVSPRVQDADTNQPSYPQANTPVQAGGTATVPAPTFDNSEKPAGTTFAKGEGAHDWATVDPETGEVTANPPKDLKPGEYTIPVVVTYPDGSTDTVNVPFTVTEAPKEASLNDPYYPAKDLTAQAGGDPVTGDAPSFDDPNTEETETAPAGATFSLGDDAPSWVSIDPTTGAVTAHPPKGTDPKAYVIPVVVTYADQSTDEGTVTVVVSEPEKQAVEFQPDYEDAPATEQGESSTIPAPNGENGTTLPSGTTFEKGSGAPTWVTVNADGSLTVSPDATVEPGTYNVPVEVTYPDGSTGTVMVPVRVAAQEVPETPEDKVTYDPATPDEAKVTAGETAKVKAPGWFNDKAPVAATYATGTAAPDWVKVDPTTGELTATPPAGTEPGTYNVPVEVTYPDGTTDTYFVPVTVSAQPKKTAQIAEPRYKANDNAVQAGQTVKSTAPSFDDPTTSAKEERPEGTTFSFEGPDWITVDPDTGAATIAPGADVEPQAYTGTVVATYPDGSTDRIPVTVTVLPIPKDLSQQLNPGPSSPTATVAAGEKDKVVPGPSFDDPATEEKEEAPAGTSYKLGADAPDWVTIDPQTGKLTLNPPEGLDPQTYNVPIEVTYSDGSTDKVVIPVNVTEEAQKEETADKVQPRYPSTATPVEAGAKETIPAPSFDDPSTEEKEQAPANTSYKLGDGAPEWASVDAVTGEFTAKPGKDIAPGTYNVPVVVTYEDGSTDTVMVPVLVKKPVRDADTYNPRLATENVPNGTLSTAPVTAGNEISLSPQFPVQPPAETTFAGDPDNPSWVTVNPETGTVTATPPAAAQPGTYPVKVQVTYPDGTEDVIESTITVRERPMLTPSYGPAHPVERGETLTIDPPSVDDPFTEQVERVPEGTSYKLGADAPNWVSVDPKTGQVTANPGADVPAGTYEIPVEVNVGGVTKTVMTQVTVVVTDPKEEPTLTEAQTTQPFYPGASTRVEQGTDVTVPAPSFDDPTTNAAEEKPADVSFGLSTAPGDPNLDWVTVDPTSGALTLKPTDKVQPGGYLVPVEVTYGDHSTEIVNVPVVVEKPAARPMKDTAQPYYPATTPVIFAGTTETVKAPTFDDPTTADTKETKPEGTKFALGEGAPKWVTIDPETGELTIAPAADVPTGAHRIPIEVTYADGSKGIVYQRVMIANSKLAYPKTTVGDEPVKVKTNLGDQVVPGSTFRLVSFPDGWKVTIDEKTGEVTIDAPANAEPGEYDIKVEGLVNGEVISKATLVAEVKEAKDTAEPRYPDTKPIVPGGSGIVVTPSFDDPATEATETMPKGTKFALGKDAPAWAKIDPETGKLTLTPPEGTDPKPYVIPIEVTYPDGSKDLVSQSVTIAKPDTPTPPANGSSEEEKTGAIIGGILGGLALLGGGAWALDQMGIVDTGSAPGRHALPDLPQAPGQPAPGQQAPGKQAPGKQDPSPQSPKGRGEAGEPTRSGNGATNQKPGKHSKKDSALAETGAQYVQLALTIGFLALLLGGAFIALRRRKDAE